MHIIYYAIIYTTCIFHICLYIDVGKLKQSNADLKAEIGMYIPVYYSNVPYILTYCRLHTHTVVHTSYIILYTSR